MKRIILIILAIVAFGIDINATNTTITNVDVETPSGNMNSNIKIFAIFPLKIARPPTVFVRALGESPALGHAARAAVFERRVRQILKFPLRACCLKRAS